MLVPVMGVYLTSGGKNTKLHSVTGRGKVLGIGNFEPVVMFRP